MAGQDHRTHDTEPEVSRPVAADRGWTSQIDDGLTDRVPPGTRPTLVDGTIVDRYVILAHLGSGGMGAVYAAWDPKLARRVALKLLHAGPRRGKDGALRLQREARALARLDHPHVVRVFDVGSWQDAPYITMELVDGAGLDAVLAERRLSQIAILQTFIAAGRGLAAAHRLGVVHRDVKAQNIFVGADGRARIGDFGIATLIGDTEGAPALDADTTIADDEGGDGVTVDGAVLGTPAYMSPEQLAGARVDARADVFSFCVALWRAAFDEDPFPASAILVRLQLVHGAPARPQRRDPALERVLAKGLRFAAADRYPSMAPLLKDLEGLARRPQRHRAAVVAVVVVVAVVAVAVVAARRDPCGVRAGRDAVLEQLRTTPSSSSLSGVVQRWVARWSQSAAGTCARGDLHDSVRAERQRCYDASLQDVAALLSLKQRSIIDDNAALQASLSLPQPERCLDGRQVVSTDANLMAALALARMALLAGDTGRSATEGAAVFSQAQAAHNDVIVAEAALVLGKAHNLMGALHEAEQTVRDGLAAAMRSTSPHVEAELWMALADVVGDKIKRHDDTERIVPLMRAAIARFPDDLDIQAQALVTEALMANEFGDKRLGVARAAQAFAMARQRDPINPHIVADAVNLEALMLGMLGETRAAVDVIEQGKILMLKELPPGHIRFMAMNNSLGLAARRDGDLRAARAAFEASVAVALAQTRPRDYDAMRGVPLTNIALVDLIEGDVAGAIAGAVEARAMLVASVGEDNPRVSYADELLAYASASQGRFDEARAHAARMMRRHAATPGVWLGVRSVILDASLVAEDSVAVGSVAQGRVAVAVQRARLEAMRPDNAQARASQQAALVALFAAEGNRPAAQSTLAAVTDADGLSLLSIDERHLIEAIDAALRGTTGVPFPTHFPLARLAARGLSTAPH